MGSTGNVTVMQKPGPRGDANSDLYIGNIGNGTLNIQTASVSNAGEQIGRYTGSTGMSYRHGSRVRVGHHR
ncbi:MAG: hypothetical protein R3C45_17340 [Phycisphaerales bacterium]